MSRNDFNIIRGFILLCSFKVCFFSFEIRSLSMRLISNSQFSWFNLWLLGLYSGAILPNVCLSISYHFLQRLLEQGHISHYSAILKTDDLFSKRIVDSNNFTCSYNNKFISPLWIICIPNINNLTSTELSTYANVVSYV